MSGFGLPLPVLPALLAAVWIWLFAAWRERRRTGAGGWARLTLLAVALTALVGLYARPERNLPRGPVAYLLTPGWAEAIGASGAALEAGIPVWSRPGDVEAGAAAVAPLTRLAAAAERFRVVGDGLTSWEIEELATPIELAAPAPAGRGFVDICWRRRLERGEPLSVRGRWVGAEDDRVELVGPGGVEDATRPGTDGGFTLRAVPRAEGPSLWRLRVETDTEGRREERIDVEVVPPSPFALLWLEDSPSFEVGPVERWLEELGRSMAVRSRVSRERYRTELVNLPAISLGPLTPELLERFDLLVADAGSVGRWSTSERAAVERAIRRDGLGLLLLARAEDRLDGLARLAGIEVEADRDAESWVLRLALPTLGIAPPLELAPRQLRAASEVRPLVEDRSGRVVAAARPRGRGTVALSVVADTFRWALRGEKEVHRAFWSMLVRELSRPRRAAALWRLPEGPIGVDWPVEVSLGTDAAAPRARWTDPAGKTYDLPLRQEPLAPELWTATLWPRESGWHRLESDAAAAWFWAQPRHAWRARERAGRQAATRRHELWGGVAVSDPPPPPIVVAAEGVRLALLLVAVGALGVLWWNPWKRADAAS